MRRNRYPDLCADCGHGVARDGGFLFGSRNAVVCEDCVYNFYGEQKGYLAPLPEPYE
ncbi:hypothetical protein [Nocardia otitidiscaviarum]|uniref:hypothetical protein n=1 Tax=Nocardia otitidiscaviarum TaxID=1823 RepID=UPI0024543F16|nr:hypothetical protein [Nocardia otitidiscaviarum]